MAKKRKPDAARKPPVPTDSHAEIEDWLRHVMPELGWVIEMAAYAVSVNVVFFGGAEFDSPPPLGEGSRYVKVRPLEEVESPEMYHWIEQAARFPGWRWQ